MRPALLDVNVLSALLWPAHEHHDAAHRWFGARGQTSWTTCLLTELGVVRLISNPAFSRDALTPGEALELLRQNVAHAHVYWDEAPPVGDAVRDIEGALQGHRQLTDAYLLALADRRKGVLATFDRGLRTLAGGRLAGALEVVPTRSG